MIRTLILAAAILAGSAAGDARSHELRPSMLSMEELERGRFAVRLRTSTAGAAPVNLSVAFPERCRMTAPPVIAENYGVRIDRFEIDCAGAIGGETIRVDGLRGTFNDVIVRLVGLDGRVQTDRVLPEAPRFVVDSAASRNSIARTYGALGLQHILLGLDHLLFVLALMLLVRRARMLLATITSFTLAHSLTLALSAVGLASAPQPLVEALVALSIVFVASEIVAAARATHTVPRLAPWAVAFAFGLLHGLGFGGALQEIGLPPDEIPLALLAFNVGVEAGQLLVVAVAFATVASLEGLLALAFGSARCWFGYAIGTVSATWFAQRVVAFF